MPIVEPALLRLDELHPHEKVSRRRVEEVAASIASLGRVLRPIIVEEKTLTIIDGHHRYHALRRLHARYAPVLLARYGKEIHSINSRPRRLTVYSIDPEEALVRVAAALEARAPQGPARVRIRQGSHSCTLRVDPLKAYHVLASLEDTVLAGPGRPYQVTVYIDPLTPREVVKTSMQGIVFPWKTTIHVTPLKRVLAPVNLKTLL